MPIYVLTGANRGLGLEFVKQITSDSNNTLIAAVRTLEGELDELKELSSKIQNITILECNTGDVSSIQNFGKEVDKAIGDHQIDFLLNSAGINNVPDQLSLNMDPQELHNHLDVNVIGPAKVVEVLAPHLRQGSTVMNMTSGLGSMGKNVVKCSVYSISKAALNMLTVHQADQLREQGVKVVCMDPGWVKTRMGGVGAILEPEESIGGMLKVIRSLKEGDSGKFYQYDGGIVPW